MTGDALGRPHHTAVEVVVRLGATATVSTSVPDRFPILELTWGSIAVLLMPNSAFHDIPLAVCDLDRARDLQQAAQQYLDVMEALWTRQQATTASGIAGSSPGGLSTASDQGGGQVPAV
jgi:hypothetical protein